MGEKREEIKEHYAEVARAVAAKEAAPSESLVGESCCACDAEAPAFYSASLAEKLPAAALSAARGCGNPLGEVALKPGMSVLDLGSGGGIDCLIAAELVGDEGRVYGLDMTDEMLELANTNKRTAGAENVEFIKGFIEDIPLPDESVDLVSSNCVINLSEDKAQVLHEACRVLKPGGTFIVADIIACKPGFDGDAGLEAARIFGCRAGVVSEAPYRAMMKAAGFANVEVRVYKTYSLQRMREKAAQKGLDGAFAQFSDEDLDEAFGGAFIQAVKPA